MREVTVLHNQTLSDIAILYFGSDQVVFAIAKLNDFSGTEILFAGQKIKIPESKENEYKVVVDYYNNKKIVPATKTDYTIERVIDLGIGQMVISKSFKI